MFKKLLVATVAVAALILPATPAFAGTAALSGVSNGQVLTGTVPLRGSANGSTGENVRHLEITINGNVVRSENYDGIKSSASLDYSWNTRAYNNGEFTVRVNATFSGGGSSSSSASVKIANAPVAPSGVSASQSGGTVTISWNANPESDITGYRVERDGSSIGNTGGTSMTDNPPAGDHNYRVIALRSSPVGEKASSPSAPASVTIAGTSTGGSDTGSDTGGSDSGGGYWEEDSGKDSGGGYWQGDDKASGGYWQGSKKDDKGVAGYGSDKDRKGNRNSKGGSADPWGFGSWSGGSIGGLRFLDIKLPSSLSESAQDSIDWGSYEETLPYDLSGENGGAFPSEFLGGRGIAARSYSIIPPDGLRWLAAGLLFLVAAALLKFLEGRLAHAEAIAAGTVEVGHKSLKDVAVAARKMTLRELLDDEVAPVEEAEAEGIVEQEKEAGAMSVKTKRHLKVVKDDAA
jgi:hypothetical protein